MCSDDSWVGVLNSNLEVIDDLGKRGVGEVTAAGKNNDKFPFNNCSHQMFI